MSAVSNTYFRFFCLLFVGLMFALPAQEATAQVFPQTTRSSVYAPSALGMGNAATAFPSVETGFYYNPAHFSHSATDEKTHIRPFGFQAGNSLGTAGQWSYYRDDFGPAMRSGISELPEDEQEALFSEALRLNSRQAVLIGDILMPAFSFERGDLAFSGGFFTHSVARNQVFENGSVAPLLRNVMHLDFTGIGSVSAEMAAIGLDGLHLGASVKHVRRYISAKNKPMDDFQTDEDIYLQEGVTTGMDFGVLYALPIDALPGRILLGGTAHDLFTDGFNYQYSRTVTYYGDEDPIIAQTERQEAQQRYELTPAYRVGVAYTLNRTPKAGTGIAIDYVGYQNNPQERSLLTHIRAGAQVFLFDLVSLRTGMNQGHPTAGLGLSLGGIEIDYAYYGVEEGRTVGELPRWNHRAQITVGF